MTAPVAVRALAARIELVVFDVDGVLTDGRIILGADGSEYKAFDVRDGLGMVRLREAGVTLAIITGRSSTVVATRMRELAIDHVYQGVRDKRAALLALQSKLGIGVEQTCYLGDDLPENARKYVEFIEENGGVPVDLVSVGPDRAQTIERRPVL